MPASPAIRRIPSRFATLAALSTLSLLVAGCGGDNFAGPSPVGSAGEGGTTTQKAADTGAFPATVTSAYGPTKVTEKPERIVALTPQIADILVSLGIQPVAVATSAKQIASATPWLKGKLTGKLDPGLLSSSQANIEKIAGYRPDLVLGSGYTFKKNTFAQMNHIAPTFAGLSQGNDDWNLTAKAVGTLTGTDGAAVVRATERRCAKARTNLPKLKGKTYQYVSYDTTQFTYGNGSWLECFGLKPASAQDNSQTRPVTVSLEKINLLSADVLGIFDRNGHRSRLEKDARYDRLPAAQHDAVVWADLPLAMATNSPGPLSMRYVIKQVTPALQDARFDG